jgi:glycine oxidase
MPRRVAIIGGGAIGLACAWRLLQRGARVAVYERGGVGRGASWASAGLLAATAGHGGPAGSPLDALCRRGLARWGDFAHTLEAESGIDVGLRTEGTLVVALDDRGAERLRAAFDAWSAAGDDAQRWLSAVDVAAMEPALEDTVVAARFCPNDHQVDARRLVAALAEAVRRAGGAIHERADVSLDVPDADAVVLAAGAWSPLVAGAAADAVAVRPLKGQMIALDAPVLRHVVFAPDAYLVPRSGGRLLVGATVEERGFDDTVTAGGVRALIDAACRAVPALADAPLDATWAGLRPATPDGAPLLGRLDDRVIVAAGHGRNGILLTPITADLIADLALDRLTTGRLAPFAPDRFAAYEA